MEKKRPFLVLAFVLVTMGIIAAFNVSITGFSVYGKLSSIFSGNALSTAGPTILMLTVLTVAVVALHRTSKS